MLLTNLMSLCTCIRGFHLVTESIWKLMGGCWPYPRNFQNGGPGWVFHFCPAVSLMFNVRLMHMLALQVAVGEYPFVTAQGYGPSLWKCLFLSIFYPASRKRYEHSRFHVCRGAISEYEEFDPVTRLLILKALCEIRALVNNYPLLALCLYFICQLFLYFDFSSMDMISHPHIPHYSPLWLVVIFLSAGYISKCPSLVK